MSKLALSFLFLALGVVSCFSTPFIVDEERLESAKESFETDVFLGNGVATEPVSFQLREPNTVLVIVAGDALREEKAALELVEAAGPDSFVVRDVDTGVTMPLKVMPEWQAPDDSGSENGGLPGVDGDDGRVFLGQVELGAGSFELDVTSLGEGIQASVLGNPMDLITELFGGAFILLAVGGVLVLVGLILMVIALFEKRSPAAPSH